MPEVSMVGEDFSPAVPVLIVDRLAVWRSSLRSMLEDSEFAVVAEVGSAAEAIEAARSACPQLTLLDIRSMNGGGRRTLRQLNQEHPGMRVVIMTNFETPEFIDSIRADGAAGHLVKGIDRELLLFTLRAAMLRSERPAQDIPDR